MDEKAAQDAVGRVVEVLRAAGRSEATVRRHPGMLERFAAFLIGRGLDTASEGMCIDFIANQTGVRLRSLREPVTDKKVQAVRRPVVLMAETLAGRAVDIDRPVIPAKDDCPPGVPSAQGRLPRFVPQTRQCRCDSDRQGQSGQQILGLPGRDGCPWSRGSRRARRVGIPAAPTPSTAQDRCGHEIVPGGLPVVFVRHGTDTDLPCKQAAAAPACASRVRASSVDRR